VSRFQAIVCSLEAMGLQLQTVNLPDILRKS